MSWFGTRSSVPTVPRFPPAQEVQGGGGCWMGPPVLGSHDPRRKVRVHPSASSMESSTPYNKISSAVRGCILPPRCRKELHFTEAQSTESVRLPHYPPRPGYHHHGYAHHGQPTSTQPHHSLYLPTSRFPSNPPIAPITPKFPTDSTANPIIPDTAVLQHAKPKRNAQPSPQRMSEAATETTKGITTASRSSTNEGCLSEGRHSQTQEAQFR